MVLPLFFPVRPPFRKPLLFPQARCLPQPLVFHRQFFPVLLSFAALLLLWGQQLDPARWPQVPLRFLLAGSSCVSWQFFSSLFSSRLLYVPAAVSYPGLRPP